MTKYSKKGYLEKVKEINEQNLAAMKFKEKAAAIKVAISQLDLLNTKIDNVFEENIINKTSNNTISQEEVNEFNNGLNKLLSDLDVSSQDAKSNINDLKNSYLFVCEGNNPIGSQYTKEDCTNFNNSMESFPNEYSDILHVVHNILDTENNS